MSSLGPQGARRGRSRLSAWDWAANAGLFALALAARALSWRDVFDGGRIFFAGNDAYYHARRILYASLHFPHVLRFDPTVNFPHGGEPIWPPLFDGAAALLVRALVGPGDTAGMERVLVWIPPLLGAATVVGVSLLGRAQLGARAGLLAGLALALLPAHVAISRIGYVDHHVAVSAWSLVLLACAMAFLHEAGAAEPRPGRLLRLALATGASAGASFLLWPGMLLHVAVADAGLLLFLLTREQPREARRLALCLAAAHALAFALVAPFALGRHWVVWGDFSPAVLSDFQPWLLGCASLVFAGLALSWRAGGGRLGWARRLVPLLAGGAVLLLASALWIPHLEHAAGDAWRWFAKQERFQAEVLESRPLFVARGRLDTRLAEGQLSRLVYAFPFALAFAVALLRRAPRAAPRRLLLGWSGILFAATVVQLRFADSFAPAYALCLGWWGAAGLERLGRARPGRRALGAAVALALLALALSPCAATYGRDLFNLRLWRKGAPPLLGVLQQRQRMLIGVADWIRTHTEPTQGFLDPKARPAYGLLSAWTDGHVLRYVARRPVVADNFGDDVGEGNLLLSERWYLESEPRAVRVLEDLQVRYVLLEFRPVRALRDFGPGSMVSRLYFDDGGAAERAVVSRDQHLRDVRARVPAVERLRLVHETAPKPWTEGRGLPGMKLYELVPGALLTGRAPPGAEVEVRLDLRSDRDRDFTWLARATADGAGRYALRVPYANDGSAGGVRPASRYRVASGAATGGVVVREADVLGGLEVPGPDLRAPAPAG